MTNIEKWRLMMSSFGDIKAAIIEKGVSISSGQGFNSYANAVRQIYSGASVSVIAYPSRKESVAETLVTQAKWCGQIKEQIRVAIVAGGVACNTATPLSEYGNKIRQIDSNKLIIIQTTLPSGTIGEPYLAQLQASGGAAPYKWEIVGAARVAGLTFAADGTVSGTPTSSGSYQMYVQVTDAKKSTYTDLISIRIAPKF